MDATSVCPRRSGVERRGEQFTQTVSRSNLVHFAELGAPSSAFGAKFEQGSACAQWSG